MFSLRCFSCFPINHSRKPRIVMNATDKCVICLDPPETPMQCEPANTNSSPCAAWYCAECLSTYARTSNRCAHCRQVMDTDFMFELLMGPIDQREFRGFIADSTVLVLLMLLVFVMPLTLWINFLMGSRVSVLAYALPILLICMIRNIATNSLWRRGIFGISTIRFGSFQLAVGNRENAMATFQRQTFTFVLCEMVIFGQTSMNLSFGEHIFSCLSALILCNLAISIPEMMRAFVDNRDEGAGASIVATQMIGLSISTAAIGVIVCLYIIYFRFDLGMVSKTLCDHRAVSRICILSVLSQYYAIWHDDCVRSGFCIGLVHPIYTVIWKDYLLVYQMYRFIVDTYSAGRPPRRYFKSRQLGLIRLVPVQ